ncbi:MAG: sigma-54 dependent transcriptional regulator [Phycisphaerae bacterium]|jgi:DNA-binding NtrC family response regulator|nr:sigma-54 dependent transcriptional regulator [Phycisphaerae bacterium]
MKLSTKILLIVDDNDSMSLRTVQLNGAGYKNITAETNVNKAIVLASKSRFDLLVADISAQGAKTGDEVFLAARKQNSGVKALIVTDQGMPKHSTLAKAIDSGQVSFRKVTNMRAAWQFLKQIQECLKPADPVSQEMRGKSDAMNELRGLIGRISESETAKVLITGESGAGKELVAEAIHRGSSRSKMVFVPMNCAGLSESLLESELFGHIKGAFTGATSARQGKFRYADGGTLFLDEVGDMPAVMQAKLLRVLDKGEITPVGSETVVHVDTRVICATNRNLEAKVKRGEFRSDLLHRIKTLHVPVPPLREHPEDIEELSEYFLGQIAGGRYSLHQDSLDLLMDFDWPGNVRQLYNCLEQGAINTKGDSIEPSDLPPEIHSISMPTGPGLPPLAIAIEDFIDFNTPVKGQKKKLKEEVESAVEILYLDHFLKQTKGNVGKAADAMGIDESTSRKWRKTHDIDWRDYRQNT